MLSVLFVFSGCEKENSIVSSDLKKNDNSEKLWVEDGEVHFKDLTTFREESIEIMNLPEPEFLEWEKSMGFKSLRSWVLEANSAFEKVESQETFDQWKSQYNDVIEIKNREIRPIIEDPYAQAFANREGIFHIGQSFVKAYKVKNVIIQDGDRSRLPEARILNKTDLNKGIVIDLHENREQAELRSGCISLEVEKDADKRRITYRFKTDDRDWSGYKYTLVDISAYPRKKHWGHYVADQQRTRWEECSWQVTDNNNVNHTVTNQYFDSNNIPVEKLATFIDCGDDTPPASYTTPNFNYRKGKATTEAMDDWTKYAIHCCGFPSYQCP